MSPHRLSYLDKLESEAIYIMREVAAQCLKPVLLFSGGKDSVVLLRLAEKAFRPGRFPFPILHIDTGHNFPEVLEFRDRIVAQLGERLIVGSVESAISRGIATAPQGQDVSRNRQQSATLLDAIAEHKFTAAFGGARRDEEKARAKERVFSVRNEFGEWDPRNQRPELWNLYNGRLHSGEHLRVFPISDWTELNVWEYIKREQIEVPSIYFSHRRKIVKKDGQLLPHSPFLPLSKSDHVYESRVRFRTVGDMICSGAIPSDAEHVDSVIAENMSMKVTERGGRVDDKFSSTAMEDRKKEGYF